MAESFLLKGWAADGFEHLEHLISISRQPQRIWNKGGGQLQGAVDGSVVGTSGPGAIKHEEAENTAWSCSVAVNIVWSCQCGWKNTAWSPMWWFGLVSGATIDLDANSMRTAQDVIESARPVEWGFLYKNVVSSHQ